jgi:hypothetical protein
MQPRGQPNFPKEEEAIPIEPGIAKARSTYLSDMLDTFKTMRVQGKSFDEIKKETGVFSEKYPALFKMLKKMDEMKADLQEANNALKRDPSNPQAAQAIKNLNDNIQSCEINLNTVLRMLYKMGTGELSQHQASGIVGQVSFNTYIKPTVDRLDTERED